MNAISNLFSDNSLFLNFFLPKILLAILCGAIIGLERELRGKPAGLRTCIVVCLGACLFSSIAFLSSKTNPEHGDPMRVIAQIVSGIGFLGAGVIFRSQGSVLGMTTGAVIWMTGALGSMIGVELYEPAVAISLITVTILVVIRIFESLFIRQHKKQYIYYLCFFEIERSDQPEFQIELQSLLNHFQITPMSLSIDKVNGKLKYSIKYVSENENQDKFYYKLAENGKISNLEQIKN